MVNAAADVGIADLSHDLWTQLLGNVVWGLAVGIAATMVAWALAPRIPVRAQRLHMFLFGARPNELEPSARRFLRISFGVLWIVDGLLQAQPQMPAGFVSGVLQPGIATAPGWFASVLEPFAGAWSRHPVAADSATIWIQIGLGVLVLLGGYGVLARLSLWASIVWCLAIWVFGEAVGGLLAPGATWLAGSPGAVLIYAIAAGLLLAPRSWWSAGSAQRTARRMAAGWMLACVVLQAIPWDRAGTAPVASASFTAGANHVQPGLFRSPIAYLATVASNHPAAVNAVTMIVLVVVAAVLWFTGRTWAIGAGLVWCAATWWLGQDFGVLGGTATDPNSALPLGLLLAVSLPTWAGGPHRVRRRAWSQRSAPRRLRFGLAAGCLAAGLTLMLVVPMIVAAHLPGAADAAAVAADSDGGIHAIPPRPAPAFAFTDQSGARISTEALRGKLVVLTFLDAVCSTDCPLIANQIGLADRALGSLATRVEFVAIDTNPVFHNVSDVAAFTDSHGLAGLANWHFVCGQPDQVDTVLTAYGISVDAPTVGMIEHSEGIYFIAGNGLESAYLDDGAGSQMTTTYAGEVRDEVRSLLA